MTVASQGTGPATGRGRLPALFAVVFINMVGFGVVLPIFPFFGGLVNASPAQTTLAMAAYSFGQFVSAPAWGRLSDRYGRRPILLLSLFGAAISYIVMAHATDIVVLGLSRLFAGLMAGNIAAAFAYIGDITQPDERPRAMGMIGAAFGMGFILGPAIGGFIAGDEPTIAGFVTVGYVAAAATAAAGLAAMVFLPESLPPERRVAGTANAAGIRPRELLAAKPAVLVLILLGFLVIGAAALMETSLAFLAYDRFGFGPRKVGMIFAGVGFISALLQGGASAPLARRFGSAVVAKGGITFNAVGLTALGLVRSPTGLLIAMALIAIGLGMYNPAVQTLTSDITDDSDRGLVMGLTQGSSSLGRIAGPAMSGTIYQSVGHGAPFVLGGAIMVVSLLFAAIGFRRSGHAAPSRR